MNEFCLCLYFMLMDDMSFMGHSRTPLRDKDDKSKGLNYFSLVSFSISAEIRLKR